MTAGPDAGLPDLERQRDFWNRWDSTHLEQQPLDPLTQRRGDAVVALLRSLALDAPRVLEIGCGNGWLSARLAAIGPTTAIDLADEVIARAREMVPGVTFLAGDATTIDISGAPFDVIVTLETFSHVPSQPAFIARMAALLEPEGRLIITTQNRWVYERRRKVSPRAEGQIRRWVSPPELRALLSPHFRVTRLATIEPAGDLGFLRIVNSLRLERLLAAVGAAGAAKRLKERVGLGQSIVALAVRRPQQERV
jgi:SAM-dependent methyltransferase